MTIITAYLQCIFVKVKTRSKKENRRTLVGAVYRPPNTNSNVFREHILNSLQTLKAEHKKCYIMGDFNINLLNYDQHTDTRDYVDKMFSNAFLPLITKPTRITPISATSLDNIYSNDILN